VAAALTPVPGTGDAGAPSAADFRVAPQWAQNLVSGLLSFPQTLHFIARPPGAVQELDKL
jgi:hypothetical protein